MRRRSIAAALLALLALVAAACGSNTTGIRASASAAPSADVAPGKDSEKVGFIFVGPKDDYGYNQAAYEGSQAVAEAYPDMEVLTAENVPEDDNATRIMQSMIDKGAKIIFATSYGHLDPAMKVAEANPDVVVVQQGNFIKGDDPAERRHLLRHGVRAGVPGRHRRRQGHQVQQARLRLRLPDPADDLQHQRLHARAPSR